MKCNKEKNLFDLTRGLADLLVGKSTKMEDNFVLHSPLFMKVFWDS